MKKCIKLLVAFAMVLFAVSLSKGETVSAWEVRIGEQNFGYRGTFDGIGYEWDTPEKQACYPEFTAEFMAYYLGQLVAEEKGTMPDCVVTFRLNMTGAESDGKVIALLPKAKDGIYSYVHKAKVLYDDCDIMHDLLALRIYDKTGKQLILEVVQDKTTGRLALMSHGTDLNAFVKKNFISVSGNTISSASDYSKTGRIISTTTLALDGYYPGLIFETEGYDRINMSGTQMVDGNGVRISPTGKVVLDFYDIYYNFGLYYNRDTRFKVYKDGEIIKHAYYTKKFSRNSAMITSIGVEKQTDTVVKCGKISIGYWGITNIYADRYKNVNTVTIYNGHSFTAPSLRSWFWTGVTKLDGKKTVLTEWEEIRDYFNNRFILVREGQNNTLKIYIGKGLETYTYDQSETIVNGDGWKYYSDLINMLYYNRPSGNLFKYKTMKTTAEKTDYIYSMLRRFLIEEGYVTEGETYTFEFYHGATTVTTGTLVGKITKEI